MFSCIDILIGTKDLRKTMGSKKKSLNIFFYYKGLFLNSFIYKRWSLNLFTDFSYRLGKENHNIWLRIVLRDSIFLNNGKINNRKIQVR